MSKYTLDLNEYARIARQTAAEGCVLLKNDNQALPLRNGDNVAVFGRSAFRYYKSGLGSGGLVNTRYTVGILDALQNSETITLNEDVLEVYREWIEEHPYDEGHGWGTVPWSQEEMEVTESLLDLAKKSDVAIVIVGRTAGEDQDNRAEAGSYLLTDVEKDMIKKVSQAFARTVVLLNVGNIIDMKWVEEINPAAVMYVWQGGQEGGNGVYDVLTGAVTPCGKLTDTIAKDIEDYPSTKNFGDLVKNHYAEDIYVGYRYFETCAKERVAYPFGYGLSYTTFQVEGTLEEVTADKLQVRAVVTNTGAVQGKEVVQVYINPCSGKLGTPARVLVGFKKTGVLQPGQKEALTLEIDKSYFASFDDSGVTGHKSCFLLEEGQYEVYVGTDVRSAACCGTWEQEELVIEQLEVACAPEESFERMRIDRDAEGNVTVSTEPVPVNTVDMKDRMEHEGIEELAYTGDKGYRLGDVYEGKVSLDEFVAQLSDEDLISIFRGEGMCSEKVTPGTAAAFGGITDSLQAFGVPAACCADGPSGIRMDCGTKAFSLPNGTSLGCTFNTSLVEELYKMLGLELRKNRIDTLLGPGINLHRNPLNGRNFEYVSEDPILTGEMGAAQLLGMHYSDVTGTIKHFCANNQEHERYKVESIVSERALRELYLKCFEIAIKKGNARSVMTTYGPVNGLYTAGHYDLCTWILRKEWGFEGIVMSDWWALSNSYGEEPKKENRAPMVIAQNDLYMCCGDTLKEMDADNVKEMLECGEIKRAHLQRNAKNILTFILKSLAMLHKLGKISEEELAEMKVVDEEEVEVDSLECYTADKETGKIVIELDGKESVKGDVFLAALLAEREGAYMIEVEQASDLGELAQLPVSIYIDNLFRTTISFQGSNGALCKQQRELGNFLRKNHYLKMVYGAGGMKVKKITISPAE